MVLRLRSLLGLAIHAHLNQKITETISGKFITTVVIAHTSLGHTLKNERSNTLI